MIDIPYIYVRTKLFMLQYYRYLVKVKVPLPYSKAQRGVDVLLSILLTSALEWGGWSAPRPGRFTPGKTRYPLYGRLGGPPSRSGRVRKISPLPGFDPRTVQPVASRYID
jgi:hypothetical protein